MATSPKLSFEGWQFSKWLTGNWSAIKQALKVGIPFVAATFIVNPMWQQFVLTVVGKFVIDSGEFFLKEMKV